MGSEIFTPFYLPRAAAFARRDPKGSGAPPRSKVGGEGRGGEGCSSFHPPALKLGDSTLD